MGHLERVQREGVGAQAEVQDEHIGLEGLGHRQHLGAHLVIARIDAAGRSAEPEVQAGELVDARGSGRSQHGAGCRQERIKAQIGVEVHAGRIQIGQDDLTAQARHEDGEVGCEQRSSRAALAPGERDAEPIAVLLMPRDGSGERRRIDLNARSFLGGLFEIDRLLGLFGSPRFKARSFACFFPFDHRGAFYPMR